LRGQAPCGTIAVVNELNVIQQTARRILAANPCPVARLRLLRDVLGRPPDAPEVSEAQRGLDKSRSVQELQREQREDGGWGAFHSRSTRVKQMTASTEVGVERGLALGLDATHPILTKASRYIVAIMEGKIPFPDYHEKNDRWPTGMRLFLASTLSLMRPGDPLLDGDRQLWVEIARRVFRSGAYCEEDEIQAHAELTGATVKDSYLVLRSRYQLNILGSVPGLLSEELEAALLAWLWQRPDGIGYLSVPLRPVPPDPKPGPFDRWLTSLELLARLFPAWIRFAAPAVEWMWEQRRPDGLWDFGPRGTTSTVLPLSDSWRQGETRRVDWTARVLALLRQYHAGVSRA